jgi:redox-sensitive bicupin YhaK (pirin superfamily)
MRNMSQPVQTTSRDAVLVEDAALLQMMGMPVLEAVPSTKVPYGANRRRARPPQLVLLGPGGELAVTDARPSTRFMLMAGKPYGEAPVFNGPFVD